MKTTKLTIVLWIISLFTSCQDENTPNSNNNNTDPIPGSYTGILSVSTNVKYDNPNCGSETITSSETKTVNITKDGGSYLLDGIIMAGGPSNYSLSKNGENFLLNSNSKSIQFSGDYQGYSNFKCGKGNFTQSKSGLLQKN